MDCEMENADISNNKDLTDGSVDIEWQIDSEWISLSSSPSSVLPVNNKKAKKIKDKLSDLETEPSFHFISSVKGDRFLVVDNKALRLCQKKATGYSYWVCSIPCCTARCVLDPEERKIIKFCRDHNHEGEISRHEYKKFINALKTAVKENPHVKPKVLYDMELEKVKDKWRKNNLKNSTNEEEPCLPSFETVRTAMYNSRNAVLSAVSLMATEDEGFTAEVKPAHAAGPSRLTRSADTKTDLRQRTTPSKSIISGPDLDDLEEEWASEPHKDVDLSDFETWLEEDVNANIPAVVVLSSKEQKPPQRIKRTPAKLDSHDLTPGLSENVEINQWKSISLLDSNQKRTYRKRPASGSIFTCPHCPYKSNRHFNVQRHERLAHSSKKPEFSCKECGTSYSLEYRLKLHIKAVHQGEGHHCHICSRSFETMTGLKSHIVTKHKHDNLKVYREPPPELTCRLCGRVFSTKSHLQKHTSTHVMVQPYRCCVCNKAFMEEASWLSHQNSCSDTFTVQCCLCSAYVPTAQELMKHMDVVHGRAEYSCHCGKMFPWKKSLLTHQQKCSLFLAERSM